MTLEEIKNELEKANLENVYEDIVGLVEEEKQRGIAETSRRNRENQGLRKYKTALSALGYNENDDLDAFISSTIEKATSAGGESKYEQTIARLTNTVKEMQTQLQSEKTRSKQSKLNEVLTRELGNRVYGSKFVINNLISDKKVDLDDEGNVVFKDGDSVRPLNDGLKIFLDNNKDIVKAGQHQGPGGHRVDSPDPGGNLLTLKDPQAIKQNLGAIKEKLESMKD